MSNTELCSHLSQVTEVKLSDEHVCEECIKHHSRWLHLRTCQTCGVTLCCDDSPHKHMTQHNHETGHPVIASAEPGERWLWCYIDSIIAQY